ncbi:MAG: hypothetical protein EAX86_03455 [Candidatus Heimdallarchaeota archaeon]|nr:hypothetical protein [Candidatus Heimdallarchaeota archaeon]
MRTQIISEIMTQSHKIQLIKMEEEYNISLQLLHNRVWINNFNWNISSFVKQFGKTKLKIIENNSSLEKIDIIISSLTDNRYIIELSVEKFLKETLWFYFKITLITKKEIMIDKFAPEVTLMTSTSSRQDKNHIFVNQPTRHTPHTDEWKSNDMPACYLWNTNSSLSTYFFVDFSEMQWMNPETIERFSIYECAFRPEGVFGLLNRVQLPKQVKIPPQNRLNYNFLISQEYHENISNQWEAVRNLVTRSFELLPSFIPFPQNLPQKDLTWTYFSQQCINDLLKEKYCWVDPQAPKYFAYVQDESEKQRRKGIKKSQFAAETMTMLDILPPWILFLKLHSNKQQENHIRRTISAVKDFIDEKENYLYNGLIIDQENMQIKIIKPSRISIGDSWYFFEPILRFAWLIRLQSLILGEKNTYIETFRNMANKSIEFVEKHGYEITAFYDPFSLQPLKIALEKDEGRLRSYIDHRGKQNMDWTLIAKNYACLGIHIYIMIQAYSLFSDSVYLTEARKAADKFISFSPDELFWEPLELAYGVAGLTELYNLTGEDKYLDFANLTALNETRMFYWYEDNTEAFNWKNKRSNLGLVMACVGIRYPAMKENVESIFPLLKLLKTKIEKGNDFPLGLLKFFNLIRINSFYYFSEVLEKEFIYPPRIESPCKFIPFEDLEMLETAPHFSSTQSFIPKGKRTGILGREIYGAGEVIWLYLMFEAIAKCNDPEILVLNLDLFNFIDLNEFPQKEISFLIYNPIPHNKEVKITFNQKCGETKSVKIKRIRKNDFLQELEKYRILENNSFLLDLNENDVLYLEVKFI